MIDSMLGYEICETIKGLRYDSWFKDDESMQEAVNFILERYTQKIGLGAFEDDDELGYSAGDVEDAEKQGYEEGFRDAMARSEDFVAQMIDAEPLDLDWLERFAKHMESV